VISGRCASKAVFPGAITQEIHKLEDVKKPRYRLDSGASSSRKAFLWLLDLGSNQGPTD
jgi:hypothetical protein